MEDPRTYSVCTPQIDRHGRGLHRASNSIHIWRASPVLFAPRTASSANVPSTCQPKSRTPAFQLGAALRPYHTITHRHLHPPFQPLVASESTKAAWSTTVCRPPPPKSRGRLRVPLCGRGEKPWPLGDRAPRAWLLSPRSNRLGLLACPACCPCTLPRRVRCHTLLHILHRVKRPQDHAGLSKGSLGEIEATASGFAGFG